MDWKLWWGKQGMLSHDKLNGYICHEILGYIKLHIRQNLLLTRKFWCPVTLWSWRCRT